MTSSNINTTGIGGGKAPKKSYVERINEINDMEMPKILRYMRLTNVVLSLLQIIAGVVGFLSFSGNFTATLVALYVIMFGLIFLLFECRLSRMDTKLRANFGFLYSYKGRAAFIFFIGFLDFGIAGLLARFAGALMCINAFINCLVMCRHPDFRSGKMSAGEDPTTGYNTGESAAAGYLQKNPTLASQAATMVMKV